jgi:hypothetical protein
VLGANAFERDAHSFLIAITHPIALRLEAAKVGRRT